MKLIDEKTGKEVKPGDAVKTFRDENATLVSFNARRVYIHLLEEDWKREFFPSVIRCKVVE